MRTHATPVARPSSSFRRNTNALLRPFLVLCILLQISCVTQNCDLETIYQRTSSDCDQEPCPPGSPKQGPGSGQSPHAAVDIVELNEGLFDSFRSVVYSPASPSPKTAPVVLFLHGYFDADPKPYENMLKHLARKGYIVIYPSYGNGLNPKAWPTNAEEALKRALTHLKTEGKIIPDMTNVAYVGHSIGSVLALHLAEQQGATSTPTLPQPKLIVVMDGAGIKSPAYPYISIDDLSHIPRSTKLLLVMAEETYQKRLKDKDFCVGNAQAPSKPCDGFAVNRQAFTKTAQIPSDHKTAVLIISDIRSEVGLRSEHNGAQGTCGFLGKKIDAIDTWGYWKYAVGALNQVFHNEPADFSYLNSEIFRASGFWSDGTPAKPALSLNTCFGSGDCPKL